MSQPLTALALAAVLVSLASAQPALRFDAASIKPVDTTGSYQLTYPPQGGIKARLPLERLIAIAYDIRPYDRIVGEPTWARTQFFDIDATVATRTSRADTLAMLRTLLDERFGLAWHTDPTARTEVYVLKMASADARLGPAVRRSERECIKGAAPVIDRQLRSGMAVPCGQAIAGDGVYAGGSAAPRSLASAIQAALGEEVVDGTGLDGSFDYYVTLPRNVRGVATQGAGAAIFAAVQEQLGMTLQREEIVREVFVVDRVSPPTSD